MLSLTRLSLSRQAGRAGARSYAAARAPHAARVWPSSTRLLSSTTAFGQNRQPALLQNSQSQNNRQSHSHSQSQSSQYNNHGVHTRQNQQHRDISTSSSTSNPTSSRTANTSSRNTSGSNKDGPADDAETPPIDRETAWKAFKRLVVLLRPEYKAIGGAVLLLFVSSSVSLSVPFAMGTLIDVSIGDAPQSAASGGAEGTGGQQRPANPFASMTPKLPFNLGGVFSKDEPTDSDSAATDINATGDAESRHRAERSRIPFGLTLPQLFGSLAAVFVVGASANCLRYILFRVAGERITMRMRNMLYAHIISHPPSLLDRPATRVGDLVSRLSLDTNIVGKSVTFSISDVLRGTVMGMAGASMMYVTSPALTGMMGIIIPPIVLGAVFYGRYVRTISKKTQEAVGESSKLASEKLGALATVQAFTEERREMAAYSARTFDIFRWAKRDGIAGGIFYGAMGLSGNIAILAMLGLGGRMVASGELTVGELASFMMYTAYVGGSVSGLSLFYTDIMKGIGASARIFEIMDIEPPIKNSVLAAPDAASKSAQSQLKSQSAESAPSTAFPVVPAPLSGHIEFENVTFAYPQRPESPILSDFSLAVSPGTVVAIAGASGSGKSTISSLLLRFYDPQAGRVLLDGRDIRDFDVGWLRSQLAIVPQDPVLFSGSIYDNITYGSSDTSAYAQFRADSLAAGYTNIVSNAEIVAPEAAMQARLKRATSTAHADAFIAAFPHGMDTVVSERGLSLSGGQRQRLAIARAIYREPAILMLDEATSSLDATSEHLVQDALEQLGRHAKSSAGRKQTVLTIAHRLSTLRSSDVVACLQAGRVAELGSFDELMAKENGVFRELIEHQTSIAAPAKSA